MESPHFPQLGDGMFFSGKSRSPLFEALGLRSSVRWAEGASGRGSICIVTVVKLLGGRVHLLTNGVDSCLVARLKAQRACLSPQAWAYGRDSVVEGPLIEERPELRLVAYGESIYTLPAFEYATQLYDTRVECMFTFFGAGDCSSLHPSFVYNKSRAEPCSTSLRCESSLSALPRAAASM